MEGVQIGLNAVPNNSASGKLANIDKCNELKSLR